MLTTPWPALKRRVVPILVAPTYGFLLGWPENATVTPRESGDAVGVDRWTHVAGPAKELPWSKAPARRLIAICLMLLIFMMLLTLSVLISEKMQRCVAHAVLTLPYLSRDSFIPGKLKKFCQNPWESPQRPCPLVNAPAGAHLNSPN